MNQTKQTKKSLDTGMGFPVLKGKRNISWNPPGDTSSKPEILTPPNRYLSDLQIALGIIFSICIGIYTILTMYFGIVPDVVSDPRFDFKVITLINSELEKREIIQTNGNKNFQTISSDQKNEIFQRALQCLKDKGFYDNRCLDKIDK